MRPPQSDVSAIGAPTHVRVVGQLECANLVKGPIGGFTAAMFRVEVGYGYTRHVHDTDGGSYDVPAFDAAYSETLADDLAVRVGDKRIQVSKEDLTISGGGDISTPIGSATLPPRFQAALDDARWPEGSVSDVALAFREHSLSRGERVVLDAVVAPRADGGLETRPDLWSATLEEADANPILVDEKRSQNLFAIVLFAIAFGALAVGELGQKLGWW